MLDVPMAWCVSKGPELMFATRTEGQSVNRVSYTTMKDAEVILTTEQDQNLYQADRIAIVPMDRNNIPLAEPATCAACSRIDWSKPPPKLDHYEVNITLPAADEKVVLHTTDVLS